MAEIVVVRPDTQTGTKQGIPNFVGISEMTAGSTGISLNLVVIPPGGAAEPHIHRGYETAIYVLEGRVETFFGPGLRESTVNEPGDFLFIPADLPHQPPEHEQHRTGESPRCPERPQRAGERRTLRSGAGLAPGQGAPIHRQARPHKQRSPTLSAEHENAENVSRVLFPNGQDC